MGYRDATAIDMVTHYPPEHDSYHRNGQMILTIGYILLFFSAITFLNFQWCVPFAVAAIFVAKAGFKQLEHAASFKPISSVIPGLERFETKLTTGQGIEVSIHVRYPSDEDAPHTLELINTQLQRGVFLYFANRDKIPTDFQEIDEHLKKSVEPLRQELDLRFIIVHTIDIKLCPTANSSSRKGIIIGP